MPAGWPGPGVELRPAAEPGFGGVFVAAGECGCGRGPGRGRRRGRGRGLMWGCPGSRSVGCVADVCCGESGFGDFVLYSFAGVLSASGIYSGFELVAALVCRGAFRYTHGVANTRGVAQLGSVLRSGRRGRGFKSRHPDRASTRGNRRFPTRCERGRGTQRAQRVAATPTNIVP